MTTKIVNYTTENYNSTQNGALWKQVSKRIAFCIDERSYACDMYDLYAEFKNRSQIEKIFNKRFAMVSPYDIIEFCDVMKNTQYNIKPDTYSNKVSGSYNFSELSMSAEEYRTMLDEMYPLPN
jgi:hypothetical protein